MTYPFIAELTEDLIDELTLNAITFHYEEPYGITYYYEDNNIANGLYYLSIDDLQLIEDLIMTKHNFILSHVDDHYRYYHRGG